MHKVHFYKAKSRLGIINSPIHQKDLNLGIEDAPDAILTPSFLAKSRCLVNEFIFTKPEDIDKKDYFSTLAFNFISFKDLISRTLKSNETQVVVGGDNSVTFSSI
ncbi:MAG: hypothetical protein AAB600_04960 [Patescibacteria group bacterium]